MKGDQWKGVPPHWSMYVTVADCDERAARATQLGGKLYMPPTDIPNVGRFSVIADPQGATFNIIQMTAVHQTDCRLIDRQTFGPLRPAGTALETLRDQVGQSQPAPLRQYRGELLFGIIRGAFGGGVLPAAKPPRSALARRP